MNYKDVLIKLASMTIPYVYDDTISFLELNRKLYKIVHELIVAMQGLNSDYEQFRSDMTNSFNEFTTTINNNFDEFKSDVNNQINTFEENINTNFNSFKTEIEGNFNALEGEFNTLKTYVDNYFANLNLDDEVSAVIQKMYSDGTLADIINEQIFNELNTKIDDLQEQVNNIELITTITNELTYQAVGSGVRYYDSSLRNPSDNELFIVTFPDTDSTSTDVELYYEAWRSGGAGWKITNISGVKDVRGQALLVQARRSDTITFEVISTQPTKELIQNKISDLLITDCGTGGVNQAGGFYYVYSQNFGVPVDKQLFTIQMPKLPQSDNTVLFFNESQSGSSYGGWKLNNVKASDVSNGLLLVQASVAGSTTTFNIVGMLPSKEIILDKIGNLLITDCGTGGVNQAGGFYYVYSQNFGVPVDKQLFTIQMPKLPQSDNTVLFFNESQSGSSYGGWKLNNVKASDVSNGLLLVQASVVDTTISFNVIAGKNDTVMDLKEEWESSPIINTEIGTVSNKCLSTNYIGANQYKLSGFFSINNTGGSTTGNITIDPLLSPSPEGTPTSRLFILIFDGASGNIVPTFINWTGEAFVLNSATIIQNESAHYFIVPQVIKFE